MIMSNNRAKFVSTRITPQQRQKGAKTATAGDAGNIQTHIEGLENVTFDIGATLFLSTV
jgi:hypothetical protein